MSIVTLLLFTLAACGGAEEPESVETADMAGATNQVNAAPTAIQIAVVTDDYAVGSPRVPFVLYDGVDQVSDAHQVKITTFDLSVEPAKATWQGDAKPYNDYPVPYWTVHPELPKAGNWGLHAQIELADGSTTESQFVIAVLESALAPIAGEAVPLSENRTLATEPDITKLTSAFEPNLDLYQMTVREAVDNELPSVVVFSTPGFCQTAVCAPVLDSAEEAYATYGGVANFIHIEVFKQFNPELIYADEMVEWNFTSEPWTYLLDSEGIVATRLGGPVSTDELIANLEVLVTQ